MNRKYILAVLGAFKRDFAEQYGILEIGIFGSFAPDEATGDSDVDVARVVGQVGRKATCGPIVNRSGGGWQPPRRMTS